MTQYLFPKVEVLSDGQVQLTIDQHDDFSQSFTFKDSDGLAINLAGYSAVASIRSQFDSVSSIVDFATSIPSPSTGTVYISLTKTQTGNLPTTTKNRILVNFGFWDLHLVSPSGFRERKIQGPVRLNRSATN